MCPCFADLFSCVHGVSASPRAARASRARRGSSMGTINCVSFLLFNLAKLCYVCCRDALCGAECAFDTCMHSHHGSRDQ